MSWSKDEASRVDAILAQIKFNKWKVLWYITGDIAYLQFAASERCNVTGEAKDWTSRKWLLSKHMTEGEIVQTAFKAVMTAIEHETREQFTYMGQAIFDPHYDIRKLVELRASADALLRRYPPNAR